MFWCRWLEVYHVFLPFWYDRKTLWSEVLLGFSICQSFAQEVPTIVLLNVSLWTSFHAWVYLKIFSSKFWISQKISLIFQESSLIYSLPLHLLLYMISRIPPKFIGQLHLMYTNETVPLPICLNYSLKPLPPICSANVLLFHLVLYNGGPHPPSWFCSIKLSSKHYSQFQIVHSSTDEN